MKNKTSSLIVVIFTILLGGVAVFTSIMLYQLRKQSVVPTVPESKPKAEVQPSCNADIMLVLDRGGSTANISYVKGAATKFIETFEGMGLPTGSVRIGLVTMRQEAENICGRNLGGTLADLNQGLTSDAQGFAPLKNAINGIQASDPSRICLSCGLSIANQSLGSGQSGKYVVVLSDGVSRIGGGTANKYDCVTVQESERQSKIITDAGKANGITYFSVGYGLGSSLSPYYESALKTIANDPDLTYFSYKPNPSDWEATFTNIANKICNIAPVPTATATATPTVPPILPSPTATATSTATPAPPLACQALTFNLGTPAPSPTATATPSGTPNSCGGTCGSNTSCQSAYFCYQGYCRNPECPTDSDCACSTTIPSTPGPTTPPVTRATQPPGEPSLPNAGIGSPTILSVGAGVILLLLSLALAL